MRDIKLPAPFGTMAKFCIVLDPVVAMVMALMLTVTFGAAVFCVVVNPEVTTAGIAPQVKFPDPSVIKV